MAVSFPLSLAQFYDKLRVASESLDLPPSAVSSVSSAGEIFTASSGNALWRGAVSMARAVTLSRDEEVQALLRLLARPGASFMARPVARKNPFTDQNGTAVLSSVVISSIDANSRDMALTGLPAGFVLTAGDYLSFDYGTSPVRRAFHQIVSGAVADGTGLTPSFEVVPPIRSGASVGAAVTLQAPSFKAVIEPDSVNTGTYGLVSVNGVQLSFRQTLR